MSSYLSETTALTSGGLPPLNLTPNLTYIGNKHSFKIDCRKFFYFYTIRLDPDSELAKDMKKLKETENLDHVLLHLLFEVPE